MTLRSGVVNVLGVDIAVEELPSSVTERELRPVRTFEKTGGFEFATSVGYVLSGVVPDINSEAGGVDNDVMVLVEPKHLVVNWGHPRDPFDHLIGRFSHYRHLGVGFTKYLWEIRYRLYWISGKALSGCRSKVCLCHSLGDSVCLEKRNLDAWSQQTPSTVAANRMIQNAFRPLKMTGRTTAAQTPSDASAPCQLGTLAGAHASRGTAANQSTHTRCSPWAGGGQRVGI